MFAVGHAGGTFRGGFRRGGNSQGPVETRK